MKRKEEESVFSANLFKCHLFIFIMYQQDKLNPGHTPHEKMTLKAHFKNKLRQKLCCPGFMGL